MTDEDDGAAESGGGGGDGGDAVAPRPGMMRGNSSAAPGTPISASAPTMNISFTFAGSTNRACWKSSTHPMTNVPTSRATWRRDGRPDVRGVLTHGPPI